MKQYKEISKAVEDLKEVADLTGIDEAEIEQEVERIEKLIIEFERRLILNSAEDRKNAIMTIHPGAGGSDSCDWAGMLLRMYQRFFEREGFRYKILDLQPAEEGGIKDATIEIKGEYAYGILKHEVGVHRLVRLSPFDAAHRRHTSFASVFVYPEAEEIKVEIRPEELKIETFRASGHGGQHVNKTSSAIRITHIPTGITAQCQNERSQYHNRNTAMKILKARLYEHYRRIEDDKKKKLEDKKTTIAWGRQIRSYILHPYKLVKDHRTNLEVSNVDAVLNGEIEEFIEAIMKKGVNDD